MATHVCSLIVKVLRFLLYQNGLQCGNLLRFAISEGGLCFMDGKLEKADLRYVGKVNRARAFADSYSKVSILVWGFHRLY